MLRVADGVVLLPGADDRAVEVLRALPQPFTTSEAREALGTTRRVVLPLLATWTAPAARVRLPDDRRRVANSLTAGPGPGKIAFLSPPPPPLPPPPPPPPPAHA